MMRDPSDSAGRSARETSSRRYNTALKIAIGIMTAAVVIFIFIASSKVYKISGGVVLFLLLLLYIPLIFPRLFTKHIDKNLADYRTWGQGATGEEVIGDLLSQLGPDYVVLHDQRSRFGNIDHIVYDSRGNIFMIETKSHRGRIEVIGNQLLRDGKSLEKDFIEQALNNTYWLKQTIENQVGLDAWVTSVIVFTNAFVPLNLVVKNVYCMNKKYLLQFLRVHKGGSPAGLKLWEMRE